MPNKPNHITILGAGPAGLAVGYFAKQHGIPFTIYEANERVGGNCKTYESNGFKYDSGAHRLHDRDETISELYKTLLGNDLLTVDAPSAIYYQHQFVDFPLSPFNLLSKLGATNSFKAVYDLARAKLYPSANGNFESQAINKYGYYLAKLFLLDYSERLWGLPANQLSPAISGTRLKGLDFTTLLKELIGGKKSKTTHLDGTFLYPKHGIGQLMEAMADACGRQNIITNARVTNVQCLGSTFNSITINNEQTIPVNTVVSTLPITLLLSIITPTPLDSYLNLLPIIKFQDVLLVCLGVNKPTITNHATLYFTNRGSMFTRVVEPRNRSESMSPIDKTSLIAEVPLTGNVELDLDKAVLLVKQQLFNTGLISAKEIIHVDHQFIRNAYPVLSMEAEATLNDIIGYMATFKNLTNLGRNALFKYTHIHDQLLAAKQYFE